MRGLTVQVNRCVGEFQFRSVGQAWVDTGRHGAEVQRRRAGGVVVGRRGLIPGDTCRDLVTYEVSCGKVRKLIHALD